LISGGGDGFSFNGVDAIDDVLMGQAKLLIQAVRAGFSRTVSSVSIVS